jgi:alkylation response protein AidB-like acyl-CoA dehydrogenase
LIAAASEASYDRTDQRALKQEESMTTQTSTKDWVAEVDAIGPAFAERAAAHDDADSFVAENYVELKERGLLTAGVPADFGGGDASPGELCEMLRALARYCSSTALALSMHTHLVAVPAWRYRHQDAPVGPLLERVVKEGLVLVSTGGSDWLDGTGTAERVDGQLKINGRKIFCSGSPAGNLLMTTAVIQETDGPMVLHLGIPMSADGVKVQNNWRVLGMRATGSNDILLEDVMVPEAAAALARPQGVWHPMMHAVAMIALPLIYSVYLGIAEAAREIASTKTKKRDDSGVQLLAGEMENELRGVQLAVRDMVDAADNAQPGMDTTNRVMMDRALAERAIRTVELAMQVVGGSAFYRSLGLERLFRDVQGARFHPMQQMPQRELTGKLALGLSIE